MPPHPSHADSKTVKLPVLQGGPKEARSTVGRKRAAVLIAVHVVILVHIAQWLVTGSTVSPLEPSEAMYTLSEGELNAGFVLFALALVSTLLFGRFFCGWGCHVIALQDASLWILRKCKLRPRAFRSRLMLWFPLGLAVYMFLWPTILRFAVAPLLESVWPAGLAYVGATPTWQHLESTFIVEDYWATFPGLWVSIPFVLCIGMGVVYFLGAKGFCTYACPYGGFFAPLDKLSPTRIVVDHEKCDETGVCTAVCTSNVRVHEEIKDFGMVVNPGCMKCLDCVSACPTGALAVRLAAPPLLRTNPRHPDSNTTKKRRKKPQFLTTKPLWDLSWKEEIGLAAFFLLTFVSVRGMYGVIPMLFAGAIAAIATWLVWKAWRVLLDQNVRLHGFQLRRRGRCTGWGVTYLIGVVLMIVLIGHSALVSWHWSRGMVALTRVSLAAGDTSDPSLLADDYSAAAIHFERVYELGLASTPKVDFQLALIYATMDRAADAERVMRRVIAREGEKDGFVVDLAELLLRQGRGIEAVRYLEDVLVRNPRFPSVRWRLGSLYLGAGQVEEAVKLYQTGVEVRPRDYVAFVKLAEAEMAAQRPLLAAAALEGAMGLYPEAAGFRRDYAIALWVGGETDRALEEMVRASEIAEPSVRSDFYNQAAGMAEQLGRAEQAARLQELALRARRAASSPENSHAPER